MSELPEHVARNRAYWDDLARQYVEAGERAWAREEPAWGIWQVPESEVQVFPEQLSGKDAERSRLLPNACLPAHIATRIRGDRELQSRHGYS